MKQLSYSLIYISLLRRLQESENARFVNYCCTERDGINPIFFNNNLIRKVLD